jgi:hypothetical protein
VSRFFFRVQGRCGGNLDLDAHRLSYRGALAKTARFLAMGLWMGGCARKAMRRMVFMVRGFGGLPPGEGVPEDRAAGWRQGEASPVSSLENLLSEGKCEGSVESKKNT